jgi:hypothetical protein
VSAAALPRSNESHSSGSHHPLTITDWKTIDRNSLVGVFSVELPSGMVINNCMLHRPSNGAAEWIAMPGAAQVERDGRVKRSGDGKPMYKTIIRFRSKEIYDRFQVPILEELRRLGHI